MTFYFAWVGGEPIPAFSLATTGDVWSGSVVVLGDTWNGELTTQGDFLTTGVVGEGAPKVSNLTKIDSLRRDITYRITGPGMQTSADGVHGDTEFLWDGGYGGDLSPPAVVSEHASIVITTIPIDFSGDGNIPYANQVLLHDTTWLVPGRTYGIQGNGIPDGTTFDFDGDALVVISNDATATVSNASLTVFNPLGNQVIFNLENSGDLAPGETYQVFGLGIDSKALGVAQGDGVLLMSSINTETVRKTFIRIFRGIVYPDGGPFDPDVHVRSDEQVISVQIEHAEGNFPHLTIALKNPRIGFLSATRNVWCWLSWRENDSDPAIPLFHGRLIGIPTGIEGEKISLQFVAQPSDYENRQSLIAASLRVPPYYDPVWLTNGVDDSTTILEARSALWHVDRVSLETSISDITTGEDGILIVQENEHIYNAMKVKLGSTPLSAVYATGTVTWTQEAIGTIDLTRQMCAAFQDAGCPVGAPNIASFSGSGLYSSWPKPGSSIGGGWSMSPESLIVPRDAFPSVGIQTDFVTKDYRITVGGDPGTEQGGDAGVDGTTSWNAVAYFFSVDFFGIDFLVEYNAKREWSETVTFFLEAGVQEIITDSRASVENIALSSGLVRERIDPGGEIPMFDPRVNSYFKTARGKQSFEFLLAFARAKLIAKARAVEIDFMVPWKTAIGLSCRWNGQVFDGRLPGGTATGKVIAYRLIASPSDGMKAEVTIGCTVGTGGSVAPTEGVGVYVNPGYVDPGYQAMLGGTDSFGDGSIVYQDFDNFSVVDDGVSLFNMTPERVIKRLVVAVGMTDQETAIAATKAGHASVANQTPDQTNAPADALKAAYTEITLEMVPVAGGGFRTVWPVDVSQLQIPKTIDLEAAS